MDFVGIMLILHVYIFFFHFYALYYVLCCVVLCCAYHVHDKMSLRCFCVSLWIPLNIKVVGIIMFL